MVRTDSMSPGIRAGDAVVVVYTTLYDTQVGDVVSYRSMSDERVVVTHRVVAVDPIIGTVTTRGDSNTINDYPVSGGRLLGRVVWTVPAIGELGKYLYTWQGIALLVYLPLSILVYKEVVRFFRFCARPTYRLRGR